MELIRWNPGRGMFSLGHRMGNLFDELYNQTHRDNSERSAWRWDPMVDIYDNDENIVIKAELPGLDKKDYRSLTKDPWGGAA